MKKIIGFLVFTLFFSLLSSFTSIPSYAVSDGHIPGHVVVKFKENVTAKDKDTEIKKNNAAILNHIQALDTFVLSVPANAEERVINALSHNPKVEFAELDYVAEAFGIPNDPSFSKQWGFENTGQPIDGVVGTVDADIDGPTAWDTTVGNIAVAVLDTGIDQDHEDLAGKIMLQKNFSDSPTIDDLYGHGTHVSGIISANTNNSIGVAGGCPDCRLFNGKVLNDSGSGAYSWIANGIIWAADNGAKVINMSLGGSTRSSMMENAVNYAWNKGVVLVAAAGNSNNPSKTYPGAYARVIAVAATNNLDRKASFSSYSSQWVDVAAPGEDIFSTFPNHSYVINKSLGYDFASGTSMATPMTSAVVGLLWSTSYNTSNVTVRNRLESTADHIPGTGMYWIKGRINAATAVGL